MSDGVSVDPHVWAVDAVRTFARTTNLLIAGRTFAVTGSGDRADALATLLTAIGARGSARDEIPDYVFDSESGGFRLAAIPNGGPRGTSAFDRIEWAEVAFMPVSAHFAFLLGDLIRTKRIGLSMVLEPKTAVLALRLQAAGASVAVFAHPDETDDEVADHLRKSGIPVFARRDAGADEHRRLVDEFLDTRPEFLIDDGSHVIRYAHEHRPDVFEHLIGAAEETTSGLTPLRTMSAQGVLRIPVIAVNDARSKTLFDNRYGTGQSCVFAILDLVPTDLRGTTAVVVGFGDVGAGVAHHLRALGASVVVVELDAVRALQASFEGYVVGELTEVARMADLLISATGVRNTITVEALRAAKADCLVAVAGGVEQEVALDAALETGARLEDAGADLETLTFSDGASIRILAHGGCINVTAAEGNPIEIMDLSFAVQLQALRQFFDADPMTPGVYPLREDLDQAVAAVALGREPVTAEAAATAADWHTTRFGEGEHHAG